MLMLMFSKMALAVGIMAYSVHGQVVVCGSQVPATDCVNRCGCGCLNNPVELVCGDAGGTCSEDFLQMCNDDCGCQG